MWTETYTSETVQPIDHVIERLDIGGIGEANGTFSNGSG
jgi:hypothetical protein